MGHIHRLRRQRRVVRTSLAALKLITENEIDAYLVVGTGKMGAIGVKDVRLFLSKKNALADAQVGDTDKKAGTKPSEDIVKEKEGEADAITSKSSEDGSDENDNE